MSEQIEWNGSEPVPDASISVGKARNGEATLRESRLLNRVVKGIFAEHGRGQRIEEAVSPAGVIAQQISAHQVATPEFIAAIADALMRIADHFDPPPPDVVDSNYVRQKLGGKTTQWIADQARNRKIPASCIVPGTGNGKPWKFFRSKIDKWLAER